MNRTTAPSTRSSGSRAAPERVDRAADERREHQRPQEPERVVEAGEEPVRPDVEVGRVVEDRVARAAARTRAPASGARAGRRSCTGSGCRPRPGCGRTSSRRRGRRGWRTTRPVRTSRPAAGDHDQADEQGNNRGQERELGPGREPGGKPRNRRCRGSRPALASLSLASHESAYRPSRQPRPPHCPAAAARAFTSTATAARISATPTMSFSASPAWNSTRFWAPSAIAPPISSGGRAP